MCERCRTVGRKGGSPDARRRQPEKEEEPEEGNAALLVKDKQINDLQDQYKQLNEQKAKDVAVAFSEANEFAKQADQYKATLSKMDSFFGLGAIWYGAHKFLITSMWVLGSGLILFII